MKNKERCSKERKREALHSSVTSKKQTKKKKTKQNKNKTKKTKKYKITQALITKERELHNTLWAKIGLDPCACGRECAPSVLQFEETSHCRQTSLTNFFPPLDLEKRFHVSRITNGSNLTGPACAKTSEYARERRTLLNLQRKDWSVQREDCNQPCRHNWAKQFAKNKRACMHTESAHADFHGF